MKTAVKNILSTEDALFVLTCQSYIQRGLQFSRKSQQNRTTESDKALLLLVSIEGKNMEQKQKSNLNILDRAISFISPRAGLERLAWRNAQRSYDAGRTDRLNAGWTPVNAPAESMNQSQRDLLRARARDLERNADISEAVIQAFERNVVGLGMKVQAKPLKKDGTEDEELAQKMEDIFFDWSAAENCDISGEQCFEEMQEMAVRRMVVDGGILAVISENPYSKSGLQFMLQLREVDEIDGNKFSYQLSKDGTRIINGIEVNKYNKPVAYWLKKITPDGLQIGESERVPAERVLYLRKKKRPTQIREISQLSSTADRVRDVNEYSEAVSIKERVLACLSVFIKKQIPGGGVGRGSIPTTQKDASSGYGAKTLSPGMITELQPGDDVASVNPSGQASNAKEFITSQQRLIASGQGLSYEAASRDMSQVNYSSARQGMLEDRKTYEIFQEFIKRHFCRIVYREVITQAVLSGRLRIPDFFERKEDYLYHNWIAPGMAWIDPQREVKANEAALETNQTTLAQICSQNGQDWREVIAQRAKEINYANKLIKKEGGENGEKSTE